MLVPQYWLYVETVTYKPKWVGCKIMQQHLHTLVISIYVVFVFTSHGNNISIKINK